MTKEENLQFVIEDMKDFIDQGVRPAPQIVSLWLEKLQQKEPKLKKITLQDIFDKAWQAFIIEDKPPAVEFDSDKGKYCCRYLTPDGKKCAIGLSLPDHHEAQDSIGNFGAVIIEYQELFDTALVSKVAKEGYLRLANFQGRLHDDLINKQTGEWRYDLEERKQRYIAVAKEYDLIIPKDRLSFLEAIKSLLNKDCVAIQAPDGAKVKLDYLNGLVFHESETDRGAPKNSIYFAANTYLKNEWKLCYE
jgi:hypothetical protein